MALLAILLADSLGAQATSITLRGTVVDRAGRPLEAVNVFVVGTLDGTLTDSVGAFVIATNRSAGLRLALRRHGVRDTTLMLSGGAYDRILVTMSPAKQELAPILVQAGRYAGADEPGAVLTPLEIVTIPGTAADVNRALQTLPGVQQVDEGNGLYVRGGDVTETRVFLNEGALLTPAQVQSPAGTFVGTLDPFLLDAVYFTAGGFGARYGDALSAVASLQTQDRPDRASAALSVGLAAAGLNVALPLARGMGVRAVVGRNDLTPVLRLNGSPRQFSIAPHGTDATMSLFWNYRPSARLSLFTTQQSSALGALNETPSVVDTFKVDSRDRAAVLRWRDVFGGVAPDIVFSSSDVRRTESYGAYDLTSPMRLSRLSVATDIAITAATTLRVGAEAGWSSTHLDGSLPAQGADQRPGARVRLFEVERDSRSYAQYLELDTWPIESLRLVAGARHDHSSSMPSATLDPRLSASLRVAPLATMTAAWGLYHQSVDPLLQLLTAPPSADLPAMRARHAIVGAQVGEGATMARIEVYEKSYTDLAGATRDFITMGGGTGRARGVDLLLRGASVAGFSPRVVYSRSSSARTDPNSGHEVAAPFDVPDNLTLIVSRTLPRMIVAGASLRYASGRPFTPVISAARGAGDSAWVPVYGGAASQRLPAFARLDLSASWVRQTSNVTQLVLYASVTNALDRGNVYARRYTSDYARHYDVRSIFNRALYFGGVLTSKGKPSCDC